METVLAVARFALFALPTLGAIALCFLMESRWPAHEGTPRPGKLQNIKVWLASVTLQFLILPSLGGFTTLAVNAVGGGLIVLPSSGVALLLGALVYIVAMDFGEYVFHRAQHAIPWMWAMHSLHHSDTHFDSSTTVRHFWLDPLMKTVTIWLAVGLLFHASPVIVVIYMIIGHYNFFTHANVRLGFGKASWAWNSPQYHRIHHSARVEHYDVNFAALLPIFDVLFGSYYQPASDEYPETGIDDNKQPSNLLQAVTWPLHMRDPHTDTAPINTAAGPLPLP